MMTSRGNAFQINVSITPDDTKTVGAALVEACIPDKDSMEFAKIVAGECLGSGYSVLDPKTRKLPGTNIGKTITRAWRASVGVIVYVIEEAAKQYNGLNL